MYTLAVNRMSTFVQVLDESANKALQLLNERYVAKVITCEKQLKQANELALADRDSETDLDSVSVSSSRSTNSMPTDPSPLLHSYTHHPHSILINSHA